MFKFSKYFFTEKNIIQKIKLLGKLLSIDKSSASSSLFLRANNVITNHNNENRRVLLATVYCFLTVQGKPNTKAI